MSRAAYVLKCVANGCNYERLPKKFDNSDQGQRRILFTFPKDLKTRLAWLQACGNPRLLELSIDRVARASVCERHFVYQDLLALKSRYSKLNFKPYIVPRIFCHNEPIRDDILLKFIKKNKLSESLLLEIQQANFYLPDIISDEHPSPISPLCAPPLVEEFSSKGSCFGKCRHLDAAVKIPGNTKLVECVQIVSYNQNNDLNILPGVQASFKPQQTLPINSSTESLRNSTLNIDLHAFPVFLQTGCMDERNKKRKNTSYIMEEKRPSSGMRSIDEENTDTKEVTIKREPSVVDEVSNDICDNASDDSYIPCQPFEEVIIKPEEFESCDETNEENYLDNHIDITEEFTVKNAFSDDEETKGSSECYDEQDMPIGSKSPVKEIPIKKRRLSDDFEDSDEDPDDVNGSDSDSSAAGPPNESDIMDSLFYCYDCEESWKKDCPIHGPLVTVSDSEVSIDVDDNLYAIKTAPSVLCVGNAENPDEAKGVFARKTLPSRMRFGPMEGKIVTRNAMNLYTWVLRNTVTRKPYRCLDLSEPGTSNWMRYLKIAQTETEKNCVVHQYGGQLYLITIREIGPGEEIVAGPYDKNGLLIKYPGLVELSKKGITKGGRPRKKALEDQSTTTKEKTSYCHLCSKPFSSNCALRNHIRTHTGEKPFVCECKKRFSLKSSLDVHIRRVHTGEKPYVCHICDQGFAVKGCLMRHMRTHSGEKPYECDQCNKRFTQRSSLICHSRVHSGEKPFQCDICNKVFRTNSNMHEHLRVHYKCEKR